MKSVLITGASGFIGKNLFYKLSEEYNVFAPSHKELDLLDTLEVENYLKNNDIDIVIHSAVQGTLGLSEECAKMVLKNNIRMFFNLSRCNELYEKMIYFGSGAEYGKSAYIPKMKEEYFGKTVPDDDYGLSKYVMAKVSENIENIYTLRVFGVFGPYENYNYRFISNVICKLLSNKEVVVHQNVNFDYLYIDDLCEITKWFINSKPIYNTYNVCTGNTIEIYSIAKMICEKLGIKSDIMLEKDGLNTEYSGDNSRLLKEIGEFDFTPMSDALDKLIKYYKDIKIELKGDY